ncbi:MAG TPA: methionyl-tRNA formyltransferase [Candidatus Saccharimonadales bacterium]|nr:methionyl-tRNA formyltransferase [Candidatus Saccharimonadales bacterium]
MADSLLFFGNERLATGVTSQVFVLQALIAAGYKIEAVITSNEDSVSRQKRDLEIGPIAHAAGIPVVLTGKNIPLEEKVAKHPADAAVLVAFGKIIPQKVIDMFPKGIINIHPSLLPKHRGPTPLESVILQGDKETGVSLMQLAAKMDAGPVYAQETVLLNGNETKQQLADHLLGLGANMLVQYLPDILSGKLQPIPQNDALATYDKLISKGASQLDFTKPAEQLAREVRAYSGWPKSRATIATRDVVVTRAHAVPGGGVPGTISLEPGQLGVQTYDGVLIIDSLIPAGKKEMTAQAFLAGYPIV